MTKGSRLHTAPPPRKFGMFYPQGYVIVAFRSDDEASRAREQLIDGRYDEDDVQLMDTKRVLKGSTADLELLSPLIRALGSEPDLMEEHRSGAEGWPYVPHRLGPNGPRRSAVGECLPPPGLPASPEIRLLLVHRAVTQRLSGT